ncbi:MAG: isoleucine--tRNA ligase [Bacteroidota bacterium]
MKQYPVYKQLHLAKVAKNVLTYWKASGTFVQATQQRSHRPTFNFYEGPPSANGEPGIHHVLARTVKDIFARYKTMRGYQVQRRAGWDAHGLPVELQVEKELGISKADIGTKISIKAYNTHCRQTVMYYKSQWEQLTEQLGYWLALDQPYVTLSRDYIETGWYLLKQLYAKGLLYKDYTIQPYSPAAGTGLSAHELNQPGCYKLVKDTAITAQFQVKGTDQVYCLAWTTTPWTLPANSALAVGEEIDYVKVRTFNPYTHQPVQAILAKAALPRFFPQPADSQALQHYQPGDKYLPWEVVAHYTGRDLVGLEYEQLIPYVQPTAPAFRIIPGDFVSTEEGTGIVHIAPTFGADDMQVAQRFNIPPITVQRNSQEVPIVDKQGRFVAEMQSWAGKYVKEAYEPDETRQQPGYTPVDVLIARQLKQENKAFSVAKHEHSYPHCWRTDKPILYYPLNAWFIRTTAFKERLIALNKTINWKPVATGTGRFENWLENLVDWNLSRDRFWGTPLPIWRTPGQQAEKCIGSMQELREEVDKAVAAGYMDHPLPEDFDPHRPDVDHIVLVSDEGEKMYREPDLVDVWFDAGAMPYAQWHYPFESQQVFQEHFPADFIAEGVDQTRGWFFTLHALAGMLFDSVAFKNVVSNGLVLDKKGQKMSKRLGNAIDPFQAIDQHGPDALRWYMISHAHPWDNLKFDPEGPVEVTRRFFATLQNTYNFFALYANLDGFTSTAPAIPLAERAEIDQWIIARLHSLSQAVTVAYEAYEPTRASRAIQDFVVDDLSNWYVRLNRKRFWQEGQSVDKHAAYQTLHTCLVTVTQLAAPIAPFYTERLYQDLNQTTPAEPAVSVHLSDWPEADAAAINASLLLKMQQAQTIASLVHSLRKKHHLKVRQPLTKLVIPVTGPSMRQQIASVEDLILAEVNVKHIQYVDDTTAVVAKSIKPNFKKLGQRYGKQIGAISEAISQLSQTAIKELEKTGHIQLPIVTQMVAEPDQSSSQLEQLIAAEDIMPSLRKSSSIRLALEDVFIVSADIPGWSVAKQDGITVALDITLNDALRQEGIARDLVNRIQHLRKDQGLAVQDKIELTIAAGEPLVIAAIAKHQAYLCRETQATQLVITEELTKGEQLTIGDYTVCVQVTFQNHLCSAVA